MDAIPRRRSAPWSAREHVRRDLDPLGPPRPPGFRPPADDIWGFGASRAAGRGLEGDPCGSGPIPESSDEQEQALDTADIAVIGVTVVGLANAYWNWRVQMKVADRLRIVNRQRPLQSRG